MIKYREERKVLKMKPTIIFKNILVMTIIIAFAPGCYHFQEPVNERKTLDNGAMEIVEYTRDKTGKNFQAKIVSQEKTRILVIKPVETSPSGIAASAKILDEQNGLLYHIELSTTVDGRGVWFRESTNSDVLTASISKKNNRVYESYNINGETLMFDYPELEDAAMDKIFSKYMQGDPLDSSPEVIEIAEKLAEFDAFYTPHAGNSLHNNPDGEMLMSVLNDAVFANLVIGSDGGGGPELIKNPLRRVCWAAWTCTGFKCRFGGWANPVCVACAGTAVACIMAEIACWFIGCNCCF